MTTITRFMHEFCNSNHRCIIDVKLCFHVIFAWKKFFSFQMYMKTFFHELLTRKICERCRMRNSWWFKSPHNEFFSKVLVQYVLHFFAFSWIRLWRVMCNNFTILFVEFSCNIYMKIIFHANTTWKKNIFMQILHENYFLSCKYYTKNFFFVNYLHENYFSCKYYMKIIFM